MLLVESPQQPGQQLLQHWTLCCYFYIGLEIMLDTHCCEGEVSCWPIITYTPLSFGFWSHQYNMFVHFSVSRVECLFWSKSVHGTARWWQVPMVCSYLCIVTRDTWHHNIDTTRHSQVGVRELKQWHLSVTRSRVDSSVKIMAWQPQENVSLSLGTT